MKKLIILFFALCLAIPNLVNAQTKNPTDQVDLLKDKVASKVAQLKLVEKRGAIGKVIKVGSNSFQVEDINGKTVNITVDELTDYTSEENSSFDFSDIKKDTQLSVLGLYNKDSEKILARFVDEESIPLSLHGVIAEKNAKDFTLTLNTREGSTYIIDIENITKTLSYDKNDIVDSAFSKIPTQINAIVTGFENPKEKNRITASRIIVFPDSPKDPQISVAPSENTPTPSK